MLLVVVVVLYHLLMLLLPQRNTRQILGKRCEDNSSYQKVFRMLLEARGMVAQKNGAKQYRTGMT